MKLLHVLAACVAQVAAQGGPGAQQVNGGVPTETTNGVMVSATQTDTAETGNNGPWSDENALQGTWSSKSGMVITGPDFFDPVDELLIEPALPGISFSFRDGHFEQAAYQVQGNPKRPECAVGALTFQHGTYTLNDDGSMMLNPISVDGRQLLSDPCDASPSESTYTRYNQTIKIEKFVVTVDAYHGRYRLDLYQFDGSPMPPLYLVYRPAQMLPTGTMNPTSNGTDGHATATAANARQKVRRSLANRARTGAVPKSKPSYDKIWWVGASLMIAGGAGLFALS